MPAENDSLERGRSALERHSWREAFERLSAADASQGLSAEDLEGLATATRWLGRVAECMVVRERAYTAHLKAGNRRRAGFVALELARDYFGKRNPSVGRAWLNRGERLLEAEPESIEHGYLARMRGVMTSDPEEALKHAQRTFDIGSRLGDPDLVALGLHDRGRILIARGQVAEGMALIDEATLPAVSGELGPFATAIIYCNTVESCRELADYRRAGEWTDAATRWCEREGIAGFPGVCRVHRAGIMRLRGAWVEAEQEVRRACDELLEFNLYYAAEAFYELGEIRLRLGDLPEAAEAFRQAHELGREPQPGLALLRLVEGKVDAALASVRSALAETTGDRLARARLLPAQVEIAVAAADHEGARAATEELESIARVYGTSLLEASAVWARGVVQLAEGDGAAARQSLRRAYRLWQELEAPYESARARVLLASAYRMEGDHEAVTLELTAARSVFERLGAQLDLRHVSQLLSREASTEGLTRPAAPITRTFMFTDIVNSTKLVEAIGDEAWGELSQWHDRTLRSLFATHSGQEIDHAGDGFFVAFEGPVQAIACAVSIQRTLADHRHTHGFSPQLRIGLHTATVSHAAAEYRGKGVHEAARIAAVAEAGEIVSSEDTAAGPATGFPTSEPRLVSLKGLSEPVRIVRIHRQ
jgi:class 3 adenylate cyclase